MCMYDSIYFFFFSSRRRHTRCSRDWSSDVCSSDLFDVTEKMLRFFLKTIIDRHLFRVKPKVIVCVPSGITEVEKRAVRDSAQSAGAKEVWMVAEPMAAAIGVGLPVETPTGNMVIDIGGGTTEIAVIALSGIVSDTSIRTGGDELDQASGQFMRTNYNLLIGEDRKS